MQICLLITVCLVMFIVLLLWCFSFPLYHFVPMLIKLIVAGFIIFFLIAAIEEYTGRKKDSALAKKYTSFKQKLCVVNIILKTFLGKMMADTTICFK